MRYRQRGVTLIELLVVMVVVSILAAIAIPSYRQYLVRTHRTHAKTALTQAVLALERCYTNSTPYAYNGAVCNAAVVFPTTTPEGGHYIITAPTRNAQDFTLLATAQGSQATYDTQCANFTLSSVGVRGVSGTAAATPAECWAR